MRKGQTIVKMEKLAFHVFAGLGLINSKDMLQHAQQMARLAAVAAEAI